MYLTQKIRLSRIIKNTWQIDLIMIVSCTGAYLIRTFLIRHHFEIPAIIPTVLGTAIAFFVGFNNNQAYDRWWEARKIWGSLVNDSRSWARTAISYISQNETGNPEHSANLKQQLVYRQIAFLYALKANLRGAVDETYSNYLSPGELNGIKAHTNIPNAILLLQSECLQQLSKDNKIDGFRFIEMNQLIVRFTDGMGMSERISNTVFPTAYIYFTKAFIWLFVVSLTLVTSGQAGVWSIFLGWLVGFVYVSTQINGMSLMNPFENNSAAIPLNQITRTIEINLLEMLGESNIPEPVKPINEEYVL